MSTFTLDDFTTTQAVTSMHILSFAENHVNLPHDLATKYREQVKRLREQLEKYINDHPDYDLVKMLHSGSLSKGTALRLINDIDTAIYVQAAAVEDKDKNDLIAWLHARLQEVYPNFDADQLEPHDHCVTITYKTPGYIKVDVVPVLYAGEPDNRGYLIRKTGEPVLTSISLHKEFVNSRKKLQPDTYAQFIRLIKWWIATKKQEYIARDEHFRFKSMIAELVCAKLLDEGLDTSDPIDAMQKFFAYIVSSGLTDVIFFTDYYSASAIDTADTSVMRIYDPVNPANNIASSYSEAQRLQIIKEATEALEAIAIANRSTTKGEAVQYWQKVLGRKFVGQL